MNIQTHNRKYFLSGIILVIAFVFIINPVLAQEKIKWMSFEEAIEKADKKPKHIFI